jgi:hypothetical protein
MVDEMVSDKEGGTAGADLSSLAIASDGFFICSLFVTISESIHRHII